jgi:hypothetical protein
VIPTSFPATTAAASGPVPGLALRLPDLRGRTSPELPPSRGHPSGCHGMLGWRGDRRSRLMSLGEWRQPAARLPAQRSASDCALLWRHCYECAVSSMEAEQDRNALPGGDSFVSIASVMVCPGQLVPECDRYRTCRHDQVTAGSFGRLPSLARVAAVSCVRRAGCGSSRWRPGAGWPTGLRRDLTAPAVGTAAALGGAGALDGLRFSH